MRRSLLVGLILCNALWSFNPLAGKILLERHPPISVTWMRSLLSFAAAWLLLLLVRRFRPGYITPLRLTVRPEHLLWLLLAGVLTFFGSAVLQILGLHHTTATANVLIIATEPLIAAALARLVLGEAMGTAQLVAFAISLSGFCLLSNVNPHDLAGSLSLFNIGNAMLLITMITDAVYSIISRRLAGRVDPISVFACSLPFGFLAISAYHALSATPFPSLSALSGKEWLALLFIGPIGTAATYIFWSVALASAPVAAVSLTLFTQPILGTIAGVLFLGEALLPWQAAGAGLIVLALLIQTRSAFNGQARSR